MEKVILTTASCENKYFDVLKVFLTSLKLNGGGDYKVISDLVNCSDSQFAELKNLYPKLVPHYIDLPYLDWSKRENMLMIMKERLNHKWEIIKSGIDIVACIDCDVIVRGNIEGLFQNIAKDTIRIMVKKEKKLGHNCYWQAGVVVYGNGENVRKYYKNLYDTMNSKWDKFYQGQRAMPMIYEAFKKVIKLEPLSKKYNDSKFKEKSVMWHSKTSHIDEEPFVTEFNKYLAIANNRRA